MKFQVGQWVVCQDENQNDFFGKPGRFIEYDSNAPEMAHVELGDILNLNADVSVLLDLLRIATDAEILAAKLEG